MKTCSNCGETKGKQFFFKKLDKLSAHCKDCTLQKAKIYYQKNKQKILKKCKKYAKENKEKIKEKNKEWYKKNGGKYYRKNRKKILNERKKNYNKDIEKNRAKAREKYHKDIEKSRAKAVERYHKDIEKSRAKARKNYHKNVDKNKEEKNKRKRKWLKNRIEKDPFYKKQRNIRVMVSRAFIRKGWSKNTKTQKILGCDYKTAIKHLEKTFLKNYGIPIEQAKEKVHIDHIVPVSTAKTEEELIKLNHYTNLQYLYESHNLQKSNKLDWKLEDVI